MAGASKSGTEYEHQVAMRMSEELLYKGAPILVGVVAGSNKNAVDVPVVLTDGSFPLEVKKKNAFEFGSNKFYYKENKYILPENELIKHCFPDGYQPFGGYAPAFLTGDTRNLTLEKERREQKAAGNPLDCRVPILDRSLAAKYYKSKGVDYIQIQGYGLYRTGDDPRNLGLPLLEMDLVMRVRCKPHKTNVNYSVQAQIYCLKKPTPSPYDLDKDDKLPPGFTRKAK
jgi:hypothetical protein